MRVTARLYIAGVVVVAVIASVAVFRNGVPDIGAFALFGALAVAAELAGVRLPNGTTASALMVPVMAAAYALGGDGSYVAGAAVAGFGGLYLPDLRRRRLARAAFNTGQLLLAGCACGLVLAVIDPARGSVGRLLVASLPAGLAFLVVNVTLLVPVMVMVTDRPAGWFLRELNPLHVQYVPFAVVGSAVGFLYVALGPVVVPFVLVPVLIARQAFASYLAVKAAHEDALRTLTRALERKDPYTAGHVERVARYARYIGEELGLSEARLERLRYAALLHDVGKLVVQNHLLNKPGRLTLEEYERVRRHEAVSVEILRRIDFLRPLAASASPRFARYDAWPGDGGPVEPYAIVVADAYDAMTSTRPYRRALSQVTAFGELRRHAGTQFDPQCVEALIASVARHGERHGAGYEQPAVSFAVPPPAAGPGSAGLGDLAPAVVIA